MAGIAINVVREPADGYWNSIWLKRPFFASSWSGRPTADQMFSVAYGEKSPWNETSWRDAAFQQMLLLARAEVDPTKRRQLYVDMQTIIHERGGSIIPWFSNNSYALSPDIGTGASVGGTYPLDNYKNVERWFFAASGTGTGGQSCHFSEKWCKPKNACIPKDEDC